ncbi:conserved hypothetical protein [Planktothrix sp. PCC 11201]|uniref:hypothetical protein n=1 Tax=Planktothrix sp. PCC 11201 TaxID=1729650 RepID=UPI0009113E6F|nr:hypothetical protein [Planktothrix sp. PCC 11201]SKB11614.1 conserved hypothetical protein [Planktothrix sp. PCC 11201]
MTNLYDLLEKIQQKQGMYIGSPNINNLLMFLCGYQYACEAMELPESEQEMEFAEFQPWLQTKFGVNTSASWAKIILLYSSDETDAFKNFFDLLTEFRNLPKESEIINKESLSLKV